jgi:hypothetical protein
LVFLEGAKKVLALADHPLPGYAGRPDSFDVGLCRRTVHLYAILVSSQQQAVSRKKEAALAQRLRP